MYGVMFSVPILKDAYRLPSEMGQRTVETEIKIFFLLKLPLLQFKLLVLPSITLYIIG